MSGHLDGLPSCIQLILDLILNPCDDKKMVTLFIRKRGMHFFSRFSQLIEPYSTFFLINLSLYNVGPKPSILSGPNGREPSKIR